MFTDSLASRVPRVGTVSFTVSVAMVNPSAVSSARASRPGRAAPASARSAPGRNRQPASAANAKRPTTTRVRRLIPGLPIY